MKFAPQKDPYKRIAVDTSVSISEGEVTLSIGEIVSRPGSRTIRGQSRLIMSVMESKKLVTQILDAIGA